MGKIITVILLTRCCPTTWFLPEKLILFFDPMTQLNNIKNKTMISFFVFKVISYTLIH